jgi:hypothetical protein
VSGYCKKCGQYFWLTDECKCKPFQVYDLENWGEEKKTIYGKSFEEIVEKWAIKLNDNNPPFEQELFETPIEVTDESGETKRFNCTASLSINYSVKEIS